MRGLVTGAEGSDLSTFEHVPLTFAADLFRVTHPRFQESRARITFVADVRNENIVVPIPDDLLSDQEIDFVTYIDPSRKTIEAGWKQSLAQNPPYYERPPISGSDADEKAADMVETVANALYPTIVNWDSLVGKGVEDGECGITLQYELEDFMSYPLPSEILTPKAWKRLSKREQDTYVECDGGASGITYRRYRQCYWRDAEGRKPTDRYYDRQDDGSQRTFERNDLATRRAWRESAKTWKAGKIPLNTRIIPAVNCVPLLVPGTEGERWMCRGLAIRELYAIDDLVARGFAWTGLGSELYPLTFDGSAASRVVWVYQAHCWLEAENDDGTISLHPCVVTCVDGKTTTQWSGEMSAYLPAIVDLKREYGLDILPANYFFFGHTEADEPDMYGYPAMYPLVSAILNREGTLSAYQTHIRKYSLGKLAVVPDPALPKEAWLNADSTPKPLDLSAAIVTLPGPVAPLAQPPAPNAVRDLFMLYNADIEQNAPGAQTRGAGDSTASGHSLTLQQGYFLSSNRYILEGARKAVEWIGSTAFEMLAALEEKHKVRASVFVREKPPADAQPARKRGQAIEIDSRWFKGNYTLVARYADVGNLAEIQQTADLADRGYASFADVMEKRGKSSVFNERVEIAIDKLLKAGPMEQMLALQTLKERGDSERAAMLESQMAGEMQPGGLPTSAIPPELRAMGPGGPQQLNGPMPGTQLPDMAASQVGGIVAGQIGAGALMNDSQALAQAGLPGGGAAQGMPRP